MTPYHQHKTMVLVLPFSCLDVFYLFFLVIGLARTANTMLSKNFESQHPRLILDQRGKDSSFLLLS
jgi:hypothetical protein